MGNGCRHYFGLQIRKKDVLLVKCKSILYTPTKTRLGREEPTILQDEVVAGECPSFEMFFGRCDWTKVNVIDSIVSLALYIVAAMGTNITLRHKLVRIVVPCRNASPYCMPRRKSDRRQEQSAMIISIITVLNLNVKILKRTKCFNTFLCKSYISCW